MLGPLQRAALRGCECNCPPAVMWLRTAAIPSLRQLHDRSHRRDHRREIAFQALPDHRQADFVLNRSHSRIAVRRSDSDFAARYGRVRWLWLRLTGNFKWSAGAALISVNRAVPIGVPAISGRPLRSSPRRQPVLRPPLVCRARTDGRRPAAMPSRPGDRCRYGSRSPPENGRRCARGP